MRYYFVKLILAHGQTELKNDLNAKMATDRRDINVRPFVAYLDRSNLSVTLPTITHDLNIDGATASIVLTIFLIGYAFSNIFGGVFTQRYDPKK